MINDILLDETGDLAVNLQGDLKVGDAELQHQQLLLVAQKGDYKQHPLAGVGAQDYLDDENQNAFIREIRKQFTADGMTVKDLKINPNATLNIDATYQ